MIDNMETGYEKLKELGKELEAVINKNSRKDISIKQ